jgi:murein DD-endopeptidase MepM/ murein hydrolase activator NlpD|tara:strand:- start:8263 stop:9567 length:1305 start_codon:yes stop_codon:yes gene_type:complete
MNLKLTFPLLKKLNNLILFVIYLIFGSFLIILAIKYNEYSINKKNQTLNEILNNDYFKKTTQHIFKNLNSVYSNIDHKINVGESLSQILKNYEVSDKEIENIKKELKKFTNINNLKVGTIFSLSLKINQKNRLEQLVYPTSKNIKIVIKKNSNDIFESEKIITKLFKKQILAEGFIKGSLYASAIENGVDPGTINEFARIYGFEIDFQRDIRKNDTFQILYENFYDDTGKFYKSGKIIYANMNVQGREIALYKFDHETLSGFYNSNGKSVEKALMKTPINGARLSSSYGLRKHPILGYTKKHSGTDFAAKSGTPVMASGTGIITRAKWCGGGGNCIKIKHNSTYSTVYAHLKNFAKGISSGKKVKQGQVIGYVGSTGMSTGPHLHYEVHINGKAVNSQKLNLPSGKTLKNNQRKLFEVQRIKIDILLSELVFNK